MSDISTPPVAGDETRLDEKALAEALLAYGADAKAYILGHKRADERGIAYAARFIVSAYLAALRPAPDAAAPVAWDVVSHAGNRVSGPHGKQEAAEHHALRLRSEIGTATVRPLYAAPHAPAGAPRHDCEAWREEGLGCALCHQTAAEITPDALTEYKRGYDDARLAYAAPASGELCAGCSHPREDHEADGLCYHRTTQSPLSGCLCSRYAAPASGEQRAEGASERFERVAEAFCEATGMLAPGKDDASGSHSYEARMEAWRIFTAGRASALRARPEGETRDG